jgi:hypothetical protein
VGGLVGGSFGRWVGRWVGRSVGRSVGGSPLSAVRGLRMSKIVIALYQRHRRMRFKTTFPDIR